MALWEVMSGGTNDFAVYVYVNPQELYDGLFDTDGRPKQWEHRLSIQPFVEKRKKLQKPQADIGYLQPGALILNERAHTVLGEFLSSFGQLLELDCCGEKRYFYNVTNVRSCIDFANSEKTEGGGAVTKARFFDDLIPDGVQIFKDPLTAHMRIYLTDAAKNQFEALISSKQLTGAVFFKAGEAWY